MLHWFKPKMAPEGPATFDYDIAIDASAEDIYALLDWADPKNAKRQLGETVREMPGEDDSWQLVIGSYPDLGDMTFDMTVTEACPHRVYAFEGALPEGTGRLVSTHERYTIEPREGGGCELRLVCEATFRPMKLKHYAEEIGLMMVATHNALAKLKLHAEQGPEAVIAVKDEPIV